MVEFVSANPTGPIHVGNGWFASYGDALGPAARPHRPRGQPGVLRQRHRRADPPARRQPARPPPGRARARGRLPRRVRRRAGQDLRRPRRRHRGRPVGRRAHPRRHPLHHGVDPHPLRRVVQPGVHRGVRRGGRDRRAAAGQRALVTEEDGALWFESERVRRPPRAAGAAEVDDQRRLHVPRRRPRLPPQQVPDPRLRPGHQRVGRRPPRPGRLAHRRRQGARHRAGRHRGPPRPDGLAHQRPHRPSGSATSSTSTTSSPTSAPTPRGSCRC